MNIAVIGSGRMGNALAQLLKEHHHEVALEWTMIENTTS
ncbi:MULTISPECIES: NAD(P)-binding domain-containing protein [Aeromonas]